MSTIPTRERLRQKPDETRTLILDSTEALLRSEPFREVSIDRIMAPTGYGRTVFYRHFTGLPDVVLAVLARVLPEFNAATQAFLEAADRGLVPDDAHALLRPAVAHWQAHGPLLRAMRDAAVYDAEIDTLVRAAQQNFRATTLAALERRQQAGMLQGADLPQVATVLAAMTQRYLLETYGDGSTDVPVESATGALAVVWAAALRAP